MAYDVNKTARALDRLAADTPTASPAIRAMIHARDLAAVDQEARDIGQHPLDEATRQFRANLRAAVRAKRATDAARAARKLRLANERLSVEAAAQAAADNRSRAAHHEGGA